MTVISEIVGNYRTLCRFCDDFSAEVRRRFPGEVHCRKGCADCCTLETVNALEAVVITKYIRERVFFRHLKTIPSTEYRCPFLKNGECMVYEVRPIICRSHGLPIKSKTLTSGRIDCCPVNFTGTEMQHLEKHLIFDVDMVTENLTRLNMALSLASGDSSLAGKRYPLKELAKDDILQEEFFHVLDNHPSQQA